MSKDDGFPHADPATPGNFVFRSAPLQFPPRPPLQDVEIDQLVEKFLCWQLPASVRSDLCVTMDYPHTRTGTNLLTADEARQMFKALLG